MNGKYYLGIGTLKNQINEINNDQDIDELLKIVNNNFNILNIDFYNRNNIIHIHFYSVGDGLIESLYLNYLIYKYNIEKAIIYFYYENNYNYDIIYENNKNYNDIKENDFCDCKKTMIMFNLKKILKNNYNKYYYIAEENNFNSLKYYNYKPYIIFSFNYIFGIFNKENIEIILYIYEYGIIKKKYLIKNIIDLYEIALFINNKNIENKNILYIMKKIFGILNSGFYINIYNFFNKNIINTEGIMQDNIIKLDGYFYNININESNYIKGGDINFNNDNEEIKKYIKYINDKMKDLL